MRTNQNNQTYRTTPRPSRESASHQNVRVWGIVGIRKWGTYGKLVDGVQDPQLDVLYAISHMGAHMIFTDGDEIWRERLFTVVGHRPMVELGPAKIPPRQKGLIRTALKGYLEGAGNLLEFKGRYMRMKTATNKCIITTDDGTSTINVCDVSRTIEKEE